MRSAIQGYVSSTIADLQLVLDEDAMHTDPLNKIEKALVDKADGKASSSEILST